MAGRRDRFSMADTMRARHQRDTVVEHRGLFREEPVDLTTFVRDAAFLGNPALFPRQFTAVREIEKVYKPATYEWMTEQQEFGPSWELDRMVNFITLQFGKGSGKDHLCRIAACRVMYLVACLSDPQGYYGLAPQDEIHALNVAPTSGLAKGAYFIALGKLLQRSPWFSRRITSEITPNSDRIRMGDLVFVSGHSFAENFEGLNPLIATADEISGFRADRELQNRPQSERGNTRSAEATLTIMRTSARTRFPATFKLVQISYPRYKGDPIQAATKEAVEDIAARGQKSVYYVDGPAASWEVNPKLLEGVPEGEHVGRWQFREDYEKDPLEAAGKYECAPSRAANRFMRNDVAIAHAFPPRPEDDLQEPVEMFYYWGPSDEPTAFADAAPTTAASRPDAWQVRHDFRPDFRPMVGAIYALHFDLALNKDRAGVAMSHVRTWRAAGATAADRRPVVKVDFVTSYGADLNAEIPNGEIVGREVQLRWGRMLVRALIERGFDLRLVTLDGWNAVDTVQIINSWGIESRVASVDRTPDAYTNLRELIYDGRLEAYDDGRVVDELESLMKLANGKIDHPPEGSKDEADGVAGSALGAVELGGGEGDIPTQALPRGEVVLDLTLSDAGAPAFAGAWGYNSMSTDPFSPQVSGAGGLGWSPQT